MKPRIDVPRHEEIDVITIHAPYYGQTNLLIAGVLGSLDEKIALNRRKIAELKPSIVSYGLCKVKFPATSMPYGGKLQFNSALSFRGTNTIIVAKHPQKDIETDMALCYKKLWTLLIDNGMTCEPYTKRLTLGTMY